MNNKHIIKNTLYLYLRMLLLMIIGLYTSQVIFNSLGEVDYGLNNVVGGLIVIFTYVNGALANATSRYLTYEIGTGNLENLKRVFTTSFYIHFLFAICVVIFAETIGLWVLNNVLNIPENRMFACNIIFQVSIIISFISILQVPYNSLIISYEKFNIYAYTAIIDGLIKLVITYIICITTKDKLIVLSILLAISSILMIGYYNYYCRKHFIAVTKIHRSFINKSLMISMLGYTSWGLLGSTAIMLRNQGLSLLINVFFGPIVNTANAIASQVNEKISLFTNNYTVALNPQIIKNYACGNHTELIYLIKQGGKFSFYLLMYLCLPIILETNYILTLWLGNIPTYTVAFTRLILILTMVECYNYSISTAIQATGNWKNYQLIISGLNLLSFPISLVLYYLEYPPTIAFIVVIVISIVNQIPRLYYMKIQLNISPKEYFEEIFLKTMLVFCICLPIPYLIKMQFNEGAERFFIVSVSIFIINTIVIWFIGLTNSDKRNIISMIKKIRKV